MALLGRATGVFISVLGPPSGGLGGPPASDGDDVNTVRTWLFVVLTIYVR